MIYAIAGGARMGAFQLNESLLERITGDAANLLI